MKQALNFKNLSATAVRSPAVDERTRYIHSFYMQFITRSAVPQWMKERGLFLLRGRGNESCNLIGS